MLVLMAWCLLGFLGATVCVNQVEYEDSYADNYDNEVSQDQRRGEWSLFILLINFLVSWSQTQQPEVSLSLKAKEKRETLRLKEEEPLLFS